MANLPAVAADGATIVYLKSFGAGTDLDPYVPGNALIDDDGNAFSSLLAGTKRTLTVALVDDNGDQILNFGGDASAANQTTGNLILSSIDSRLAGTLSATQSGAWTVAISNFPATQPVSASSLPSVTLSSESGFLTYRNTALTNTAVAVKASAGSVMGWNFINVNTVPVYVKFYNIAAASVTVGSSAVVLTIMVPAGDGVTPGMFFMEPGLIPVEVFSTAISIACVTGLADNSNAAPSTAIHASVRYK